MDYAAMLLGRPFSGQGYTNPYERLFADFISTAEAFQRQYPKMDKRGTLAAPGRSQGGMALPQDQYQRTAPPSPQMFGGLTRG